MIRSLRSRLQFWYAGILLVVLLVFGSTVFLLERRARRQQMDDELHRIAEMIVSNLRPPLGGPFGPRNRGEGGPNRNAPLPRTDNGPRAEDPNRQESFPRVELPADVQQLFETREPDDGGRTPRLYFVLWRPDEQVVFRSPAAPDIPFPREKKTRDGRGVSSVRQREDYREVIHELRFGVMLLVGRSTTQSDFELTKFGGVLIGLGGCVLAIGILGGWLVSGRVMQPIADMSDTAVAISASNLSRRINAAETVSELGHLAETLNDMFSRLESSFQQQVQFLADASHELRTPLSVILTNAELALRRERSAAEYRESIETCYRAASRMKSLVDSLLKLARMDSGEFRLNIHPFDLSEVAIETVELLRPLAAERSITLETLLVPIAVLGDSEQISQVLTNLLTNAIRYQREHGKVEISVRVARGNAIVSVTDDGPGIAPEHLPHLFERFYRVDKARSRLDGGGGLGLAICKSIVEAHGGEISVTSRVGEGTTFEFQLPVHAPSPLLMH